MYYLDAGQHRFREKKALKAGTLANASSCFLGYGPEGPFFVPGLDKV